jgi:hypothetical protein
LVLLLLIKAFLFLSPIISFGGETLLEYCATGFLTHASGANESWKCFLALSGGQHTPGLTDGNAALLHATTIILSRNHHLCDLEI